MTLNWPFPTCILYNTIHVNIKAYNAMNWGIFIYYSNRLILFHGLNTLLWAFTDMFCTVRSSTILPKFSEKSVRNARKMKITPACPRFPEPGNVEVFLGLAAEESWPGSFPSLLCPGSPLCDSATRTDIPTHYQRSTSYSCSVWLCG